MNVGWCTGQHSGRVGLWSVLITGRYYRDSRLGTCIPAPCLALSEPRVPNVHSMLFRAGLSRSVMGKRQWGWGNERVRSESGGQGALVGEMGVRVLGCWLFGWSFGWLDGWRKHCNYHVVHVADRSFSGVRR